MITHFWGYFFLFFLSYRITTRPGGALLQKKIKWIAAAAADLLHSLLLQQPHFFISYSTHFHVSFFFTLYTRR
jgi:hypothetical protein